MEKRDGKVVFTCMRRGFTLIELLVVISIIALLLSVLMPALSTAKEKARIVICGAQLGQIGTTFHTYAVDYKDELPPSFGSGNWNAFYDFTRDALGSYSVEDGKIFYCPSYRSDTPDPWNTPVGLRRGVRRIGPEPRDGGGDVFLSAQGGGGHDDIADLQRLGRRTRRDAVLDRPQPSAGRRRGLVHDQFVHVFFLICATREEVHLQLMARLSWLTRREEVVAKLRQAGSARQVQALAGDEGEQAAPHPGTDGERTRSQALPEKRDE